MSTPQKRKYSSHQKVRTGDRIRPGSIPTSKTKLKSQIRQATRLLKREDIRPELRESTEQRLTLLEKEIAKADNSIKERKLALRYRGVRFFERQKLLRRIAQLKKDEKPDAEKLEQLRIDLYYVVHYPKNQKYVALFPEGTYAPFELPKTSASSPLKNTKDASATRAFLRKEIKDKIGKGLLKAEAEDHVSKEDRLDAQEDLDQDEEPDEFFA